MELREVADYEVTLVSRKEAERALHRAGAFVDVILGGSERS